LKLKLILKIINTRI